MNRIKNLLDSLVNTPLAGSTKEHPIQLEITSDEWITPEVPAAIKDQIFLAYDKRPDGTMLTAMEAPDIPLSGLLAGTLSSFVVYQHVFEQAPDANKMIRISGIVKDTDILIVAGPKDHACVPIVIGTGNDPVGMTYHNGIIFATDASNVARALTKAELGMFSFGVLDLSEPFEFIKTITQAIRIMPLMDGEVSFTYPKDVEPTSE